MQLFIVFIFGAVVIGAGALLSPALPTRQPRVALSATLALALIAGGSVFYAEAFGWDTLVIDYLLFALLAAVVLGGTLSHAETRAEARGEILTDAEQGWPGPYDLIFLGMVAILFIVPLFLFPVPLGTDAMGTGYLAFTARTGDTFNTLAPFHPEIEVLYAPGFQALTAYLSQQLGQPIPMIQMGVAAITGLLCIWLAYDFGAELKDKRLGRAMALAMLLSLGIGRMYLVGQFSGLMALAFAFAFLLFALRYLRHQHPVDAVAGGLMLGAVAISNPTIMLTILLGYIPWLATMWLVQRGSSDDPRPTGRTWLILTLGMPLVALLGIAPWLINNLDLLSSGITSPFRDQHSSILSLLLHHGVWIVIVAGLGIYVALRQANSGTRQVAILSLVWLLFILDAAVFGIVPSIFPIIGRFLYPEHLAQQGPIIPFTILGGIGLLWLWERVFEQGQRAWLRHHVNSVVVVFAVILLAAILFSGSLLPLSQSLFDLPGLYASDADVAAMRWLHDNTPEDSRILNYPEKGVWTTVIAERDSIYIPALPFTRGGDKQMIDDMRSFWQDPAANSQIRLLEFADIDYILVPQSITHPDSDQVLFETSSYRIEAQSSIEDSPYLELVFEQDGAQVYIVAE